MWPFKKKKNALEFLRNINAIYIEIEKNRKKFVDFLDRLGFCDTCGGLFEKTKLNRGKPVAVKKVGGEYIIHYPLFCSYCSRGMKERRGWSEGPIGKRKSKKETEDGG